MEVHVFLIQTLKEILNMLTLFTCHKYVMLEMIR